MAPALATHVLGVQGLSSRHCNVNLRRLIFPVAPAERAEDRTIDRDAAP